MLTGSTDLAATIDSVIRSRKTTRAFRPDQVLRAQIHEILETARAAPSTFNTQPWRVHVLGGKKKQALSEALVQVSTITNLDGLCGRFDQAERWTVEDLPQRP